MLKKLCFVSFSVIFGIYSATYASVVTFNDESGQHNLSYPQCASAGQLGAFSGFGNTNYIGSGGDINTGMKGSTSGQFSIYDLCYDEVNDQYVREKDGCGPNWGDAPTRQAYLIQAACSINNGPGNPPDLINSNHGMTSQTGAGHCWCRAMDGYGNFSKWTYISYYGAQCMNSAGACFNVCSQQINQRGTSNGIDPGAYGSGWNPSILPLTSGGAGYQMFKDLHQFTTAQGKPYRPMPQNMNGQWGGLVPKP